MDYRFNASSLSAKRDKGHVVLEAGFVGRRNSQHSIGLDDISVEEFLYYAAFCLYAVSIMFSWMAIQSVVGVDKSSAVSLLQYLVLALLTLKLIVQNNTRREYLLTALLLIVALISYRASGTNAILFIASFVSTAKGVRIRKIALISLIVVTSMFIITVALSTAGLIPSYYMMDNDGRGFRSALGFNHPNQVGLSMLEISLSATLLYADSHKGLCLATYVVSLLVVAQTSVSKTSIVAQIAAIALLLIYWKKGVSNRRMALLSAGVVVATVVGSFLLMVFYDSVSANSVIATIDDWTSGRIRLMNEYFQYRPITPFGSSFSGFRAVTYSVASGEAQTFVVDNSYARLYLRNGIICAFVLLSAVLLVYRKAIRDEYYGSAVLCLTIVVIAGFTESIFLSFSANYYLILLSPLLFKSPLKDIAQSRT